MNSNWSKFDRVNQFNLQLDNLINHILTVAGGGTGGPGRHRCRPLTCHSHMLHGWTVSRPWFTVNNTCEQDSPEITVGVTDSWWKNPTHPPLGSLRILIFPGRNRRSGLLLAAVNLSPIKKIWWRVWNRMSGNLCYMWATAGVVTVTTTTDEHIWFQIMMLLFPQLRLVSSLRLSTWTCLACKLPWRPSRMRWALRWKSSSAVTRAARVLSCSTFRGTRMVTEEPGSRTSDHVTHIVVQQHKHAPLCQLVGRYKLSPGLLYLCRRDFPPLSPLVVKVQPPTVHLLQLIL